jgi:hypothetical protein
MRVAVVVAHLMAERLDQVALAEAETLVRLGLIMLDRRGLQTQVVVVVVEVICQQHPLVQYWAAQAALVLSLSKLTNKTYDRKNLSFVRHQHGNAFVTPWC